LHPNGFYGGIATLLIVAATLANKLGYDLRIVQTTGYSKDTKVLEFLALNGITIPESRFSTCDLSYRSRHRFGHLPLHPEDVVIVSAWWDAYVASQLPLQKKFVYMIQDYEPIFYNNSDSRVLAERTYHNGAFVPLCNTKLLYDFFREHGYAYIEKHGLWFEPAPAPRRPASKPRDPEATRWLFLYGRPQVHRNLYYTALRAIDRAFASEELNGRDWELFSAGQSDVPPIKLNSGHIIKNLGKMDLMEYYDFIASVDVAVSPMLAPHPNYPTLELASLGAMVVSTKYENKQNLSRYSRNVLLADPTADDMAAKIIVAGTTDLEQRLANLEFNNIGDRWPDALAGPVGDLAKRL
jgi:hypothetical protein